MLRTGLPGHLGGQSLVDLGVGVLVEALVGDLAPVGGEVELGRVVLVVAAEAELATFDLGGVQGDRLADPGVDGVLDVLRGGAVAVLALVPLQVGGQRGRLPARVVLEAGRVATDAFGVELVVARVRLSGP